MLKISMHVSYQYDKVEVNFKKKLYRDIFSAYPWTVTIRPIDASPDFLLSWRHPSDYCCWIVRGTTLVVARPSSVDSITIPSPA